MIINFYLTPYITSVRIAKKTPFLTISPSVVAAVVSNGLEIALYSPNGYHLADNNEVVMSQCSRSRDQRIETITMKKHFFLIKDSFFMTLQMLAV
jgi:hypothetical protein